MRRSRTSTISAPMLRASPSAFWRVADMIWSRCVEIASCIVRLLNSSARFERTVCESRRRAASSSPWTDT